MTGKLLLATNSPFPRKRKLGKIRLLAHQYEPGQPHNTNYTALSNGCPLYDDENVATNVQRLEPRELRQASEVDQLNKWPEMEIEVLSSWFREKLTAIVVFSFFHFQAL